MIGEVTPAVVVEILATSANLLYLVLLIREKILCWAFGIVGCLLSVYLFIETKLYSEAALYLFYAALALWGWLRWKRKMEEQDNPVIMWHLTLHIRVIFLALIAGSGLGYLMQMTTDAQRPLIDAFTTVFGVLATYMEIAKVLEGWIYWFVINLVSIWLYHDRELDIYAALIALYSVLSIVGFIQWRESYRSSVMAAAPGSDMG